MATPWRLTAAPGSTAPKRHASIGRRALGRQELRAPYVAGIRRRDASTTKRELGPPRPVPRLRAVIRPVDVLQLRVYGDPTAMTAVAEGLGDLAGARHVALASNDRGGTALVTADVRTDAADAAVALLARLGVPADDVVFARLD